MPAAPASLASTHFFLPVRTVCVTVVFGLRLVVDFVTKRPEMAERFTLRVAMSHLLSCSSCLAGFSGCYCRGTNGSCRKDDRPWPR